MIFDHFLRSVFGIAFLKALIPCSMAFWMVTYQRIGNVKLLDKLSGKFWGFGFISSTLGVALFWSEVYAYYYGSIAANAMESTSDMFIFILVLPGISAYFSYSLINKFKKELSL
jgi:hypothetical protein